MSDIVFQADHWRSRQVPSVLARAVRVTATTIVSNKIVTNNSVTITEAVNKDVNESLTYFTSDIMTRFHIASVYEPSGQWTLCSLRNGTDY